jgi:hypothetical protein
MFFLNVSYSHEVNTVSEKNKIYSLPLTFLSLTHKGSNVSDQGNVLPANETVGIKTKKVIS